MKLDKVPGVVIQRLPRYYRYLGELLEEKTNRISSMELSRRMGLTSSQIRQDFCSFGEFGLQGYGYNVKYLREEIGKILDLDRMKRMIIVGAGNLGQALANYQFDKVGFELIGIFDDGCSGKFCSGKPGRYCGVDDSGGSSAGCWDVSGENRNTSDLEFYACGFKYNASYMC